MTEVPVWWFDGDELAATAYQIADTRLNTFAQWDEPALAQILEQLLADALGFLRSVFASVLEVLGPKGAIYCWHAHKRFGDIQRIWRDLGILDHQQIIWVKPAPVFGRVYWHFRHEPCVMGWRQGDKPEHDGVHDHDSVWEVDWDGKARVVGNEHPMMKPVELFGSPDEEAHQRRCGVRAVLGQRLAADRRRAHGRALPRDRDQSAIRRRRDPPVARRRPDSEG